MSLLAPLMLAGLAAIVLPVIAHLLGRESPRRVRLATVRFIEPAEPVITRRRRVHDPLLLAVRLALLALLVLVLARPVGSATGGLAVVSEPHDAIILVDGSRSMALVVEGLSVALNSNPKRRLPDTIIRSSSAPPYVAQK